MMWYIIGTIWLVWIVVNTIALFGGKWFFNDAGFNDAGAFATGIFWTEQIHVSPRALSILTADELAAIVAHEEGHIHHHHILENYLVAAFAPFALLLGRRRRMVEQEYEADDYAAERVSPQALASALRKLSAHSFDTARAERLDHWRY